MGFQQLPMPEKPQFYINVAFSQAQKAAGAMRSELKGRGFGRMQKSRMLELSKISIVRNSLTGQLLAIVKTFPSIDRLDKFYQELVKCSLDHGQLKKSLAAVLWASNQISILAADASRKIKQCKKPELINQHRNAFYGRAASVLKQISKYLDSIKEAGKIMRQFPSVKTGMPTAVIAGAPNVGKSSLLAALTGSAPKVAPYPFTTQQLMIGYLDERKVQLIDTPGLLDRPLSERNKIEKQAILALKHLSNLIIFVFDPTELCGYTLDIQANLYKDLEQEFGVKLIAVVNKEDIAPKESLAFLSKKTGKELVTVSAKTSSGINELKAKIYSALDVK